MLLRQGSTHHGQLLQLGRRRSGHARERHRLIRCLSTECATLELPGSVTQLANLLLPLLLLLGPKAKVMHDQRPLSDQTSARQRDTMGQCTRQYVAPAPTPHLHKRPHQRHRALKPCLGNSDGPAKTSQLSVVLAPPFFSDCRLTASNSRFRTSLKLSLFWSLMCRVFSKKCS